jgi:F0F1-type ATP synthase membrane subunit b/b'
MAMTVDVTLTFAFVVFCALAAKKMALALREMAKDHRQEIADSFEGAEKDLDRAKASLANASNALIEVENQVVQMMDLAQKEAAQLLHDSQAEIERQRIGYQKLLDQQMTALGLQGQKRIQQALWTKVCQGLQRHTAGLSSAQHLDFILDGLERSLGARPLKS